MLLLVVVIEEVTILLIHGHIIEQVALAGLLVVEAILLGVVVVGIPEVVLVSILSRLNVLT